MMVLDFLNEVCKYGKVHIFWGGHKILRNLHRRFDWHYIGQITNFTQSAYFMIFFVSSICYRPYRSLSTEFSFSLNFSQLRPLFSSQCPRSVLLTVTYYARYYATYLLHLLDTPILYLIPVNTSTDNCSLSHMINL